MELIFEKFPKISRLKRGCIITEKIDGTNGQVLFNDSGEILVGSRNRVITPEQDNFGFAEWAYANKDSLFNLLGAGRHYGEWWGSGIQRRYGRSTRTFSLFNTTRWSQDDPKKLEEIEGLSVVPILYQGDFDTSAITACMEELGRCGSVAAEGYDNPEGIIIFHSASRTSYKRTFEHDEGGKPSGY